MNDNNPYKSPVADIDNTAERSVIENKERTWRTIACGIVLFSVSSFIFFITLLITFFGESEEMWPVIPCGIIGVIVGGMLTLAAFKSRLLVAIGLTSLISIVFSSIVLIMALAVALKESIEDVPDIFFPLEIDEIVPGHFILILSTICGTCFGINGIVAGVRDKKNIGVIAGGMGSFFCILYLVYVGASIFMSLG